MRVYTIRLIIALLSWSAAVIAQAAPQQSDAIPGPTARILVTIASSGRTPAKTDFAAFVDNQPAHIVELLAAKDDQLIFAVLMDVSSSSRDKQTFEKKASVELFRALKTGENIGYFGGFDNEVYLKNSPTALASVNAELKKIDVFGGRTAFYDAVFRAAQLVGRAPSQPNARRAVFVLTDGDDNDSHRTLKEATQEAQRQGVAVFCVALDSSKKAATRLRMLSAETGGSAVFLTRANHFIPPLLRVLQDQYWVTLTVPGAGDSKLNTFTLASSDSGARISAPTYVLLH